MKRTKQEKAITLIALIITIIILLILAVVTINAIQGDEGLITKANNAAKKYKDAASEENSLIQKYLAKIPEDDDTLKEDDDTYAREVPDILNKYIFGADLQGRSIIEIFNTEELEFLDEISTISDASTSVTYNDSFVKDLSTAVMYFSYNSSIYKFEAEMSTYNTIASRGVTNIGSLITATSTSSPKVGSTISYDGKTWTVMYINGNNIQMISNNALQYNGNSLYLGYNDTYLIAKGTLQGTTDIDKAIYSYNNAITTLNSACDEIVTKASFVTDVRCVGSNLNSKNSESLSNYTSDWLTTHPTNNVGTYNNKGKCTDNNYETDLERLMLLEKTKASNETSYWLASRVVYTISDEVEFCVRNVDSDGLCSSENFWSVRESYVARSNYYPSICLRPVVTIDTTKCTFSYDSGNNYFTVSAK